MDLDTVWGGEWGRLRDGVLDGLDIVEGERSVWGRGKCGAFHYNQWGLCGVVLCCEGGNTALSKLLWDFLFLHFALIVPDNNVIRSSSFHHLSTVLLPCYFPLLIFFRAMCDINVCRAYATRACTVVDPNITKCRPRPIFSLR